MGICTQNPKVKKISWASPSTVMNFMKFMAQELRETAKLSAHGGRTEFLRADLLKPSHRQVPHSENGLVRC